MRFWAIVAGVRHPGKSCQRGLHLMGLLCKRSNMFRVRTARQCNSLSSRPPELTRDSHPGPCSSSTCRRKGFGPMMVARVTPARFLIGSETLEVETCIHDGRSWRDRPCKISQRDQRTDLVEERPDELLFTNRMRRYTCSRASSDIA